MTNTVTNEDDVNPITHAFADLTNGWAVEHRDETSADIVTRLTTGNGE